MAKRKGISKRKRRLNLKKKIAIILNSKRLGIQRFLGIGDYNSDYNNDYWIGND